VVAELLKHPRALVLSLLVHFAVIALMVLNLTFFDKPKHLKAGPVAKTVQAEMVDLKQIEEQNKKKQLDAKRKAEAEQKKKLEAKKRADKKKREADQKRKKDQQKKADLNKKKKAEAKRKKEVARKKEEKRSADAKRKADEKRKVDATRQADEKRKVEEARVAEEKRKAKEATLIAEEKRKIDEARRLEEEKRRRAEQELKARMLAEENQQKLNSLREAYILAIRQKVERNWIKPAGSGKMSVCEVHVVQGPGGIILDVDFGACGGSTATYRASIENAVYKAEPLPKPGDPKLFERELNFFFNPSVQ
jgi:colicin import membrane protein